MVPADGRETAFPGLIAGRARRRGDSVVRSLHAFGAGRGAPASAACLLDYDVIEAFCVAGLPGRAASTRGTHRSVLYALAGQIHGPPSRRATPSCGAQAPPPYSPDERAELIWIAMAQRSPVKRSSALAVGWFGIGAALPPGELTALRGTDLGRPAATVGTRVAGPAPPTVPAAGPYGPPLADLPPGAG